MNRQDGIFFFSSRRRHTRLQGDWSSDVCSSDLVVVGNGTGGSRSLYGAGSAVKLLVDKLIETAKPLAAAALGSDAVEYRDGKFEAGSQSISFFYLAQKLAGQSPHPMDCVAAS